MGFDAVAQVQAGAGVDGVGVVEDLAEFVEGGGMAWRGERVEPDRVREAVEELQTS